MNPIKNQETEQFCQRVANEYKVDIINANKMVRDFVAENRNIKYWEMLAINDRIRYIIKNMPELTVSPPEYHKPQDRTIKFFKNKGK